MAVTDINVPQLAWHNPRDLTLSLPDSWHVETFDMAGHDRPAMTDEQINQSITSLMGSPPIRELAQGKKDVVITFDDMTRVTRVHRMVPSIIRELEDAGIPDSNIRFIAATGTHGPLNRLDFIKKLGEAAVARFPAYSHNCHANCDYVGTTRRGTEIYINREYMQCDFKIAIGSILPHPFSVFAGGGKNIVPGVASMETIYTNHVMLPHTEAEDMDFDTNPRRLDMEEGARLAGLDILVECVVNGWGDTAALFAGDPAKVRAASVQEARQTYLTEKAEDMDIVISNAYAEVMVSSILALTTGVSVTQRGGDMVLISNSPEGQVSHYLNGPWGTRIGGKSRFQIPVPPQINHLILYNEYPDKASLGWFESQEKIVQADNWDTVLEMLKEYHGNSANVAVYPNADILYFK
jgi:nickel-dependent lactate racemase